MKVYLELPVPSRGLQRVRDALERYKPDTIEITKYPSEADLTIIHVFGRHDKVKEQTDTLRRSHRAYAMIQYVIRSSMRPSTLDWIDMWTEAKLIWSYYNLTELYLQDRQVMKKKDQLPFNFYHAPLGVDTEIFRDYNMNREYTILASGQHALAEGVRECAFATKRVNGKMIHLGHELRRGEDIKCISRITDDDLAQVYSQCQFVSGLRRIEGFELGVLEGFMCGARPVVYDRPHYRKWYDELAVFIEERAREYVIDDLEQLFKQGAKPVTQKEKDWVKQTFNWQIIIEEFWKRILA